MSNTCRNRSELCANIGGWVRLKKNFIFGIEIPRSAKLCRDFKTLIPGKAETQFFLQLWASLLGFLEMH